MEPAMETPHHQWLREKLAERCIKNLRRHSFDAHFVSGIPEARELILGKVGALESFGFGGSDTVRRLGIIDALREKGKILHDHWQDGLTPEADLAIRRRQGAADCFFCSANAVAATGEIVNVDGVGNRTNAMCFGPKSVFIVAGVNKITPDLASGLNRVREIAAPMRAKSLGMDTPCAETGICTDCNSPQRICRITVILHRKPMKTDVSVVIIGQSLGF